MSTYSQGQDRDANRQIIASNHPFKTTKSIVFDGGAADDTGDFDGAGNPTTLFTITGTVLVAVFAVCSESLAGATATIEVGVAGLSNGVIAQTTATDIDAGQVWVDASPSLIQQLPNQQVVTDLDIIQTVGTADITDGTLEYYALWRPLSSDANLVAA